MRKSPQKKPSSTAVEWPEGKDFAFTVFDDTDCGKLHRIIPIYELLHDCGLRTTKSVWPFDDPEGPRWAGPSCEDSEHLEWLRQLRDEGFEIGYHGASFGNNPRDRIAAALARFEELFGSEGIVYANHFGNREAMYYHDARVSGTARWAYGITTRFRTWRRSNGHVESTPYFWGDMCKAKVRYARSFVYNNINVLRKCPFMPYYDPQRPFVNAWFASSEGRDADAFCKLLSPANQDRLQRERGACIVYTHFAYEFVRDGKVRDDVRSLVEQLSARNGWFVPVGTLLDHMKKAQGGVHRLLPRERRRLEWAWLRSKMLSGSA